MSIFFNCFVGGVLDSFFVWVTRVTLAVACGVLGGGGGVGVTGTAVSTGLPVLVGTPGVARMSTRVGPSRVDGINAYGGRVIR